MQQIWIKKRKFQIIRQKSTFRAQRTEFCLVTLLAVRRSAPWCVADNREVSSRQPVAERWLAGSRVTVNSESSDIKNRVYR